MELYDKTYFAALKKRIKAVDKVPILFGLNYLGVSILFFFVWSNIIFSINLGFLNLVSIPIGLFLPFLLLYTVTKKENSTALLFVIAILSSNIFFELFDLAYYYNIYNKNLPVFESDVCSICEVEESIKLIAISLIAILLMINKPMITKFSLSKRSISLAILLPSTILIFRTIRFLI